MEDELTFEQLAQLRQAQMKFDKYLVNVDLYSRDHPRQRVGQVFFNVLLIHHPDVAARIRGTQNDPFHNDDVIPVFLIQVAELLEG